MLYTTQKNNALLALSELLIRFKLQILEANQRDLDACPDMNASLRERLKVDQMRVFGMAKSLQDVAKMRDPEDHLLSSFQREDGLKIENRTIAFGTVLIIYESRPDVTIEATATALKAGNRILLKGGKESHHTNKVLVDLWKKALVSVDVDTRYVEYLDISREETQAFIRSNPRNIDLIIPRGGESLINFVRSNTTIPLIISGRGNNFLYVDEFCDFEMVIDIALNGKKRISVCNALDKILLHKNIPLLHENISQLVDALQRSNLSVLGNKEVAAMNDGIELRDDEAILSEEFLSEKIYLRLVDDMHTAISMINTYSGGHSASIVTYDNLQAEKFLHEVDCAAVYHNASTRFTDGGQFGIGAEIAISTQKLHFRGPIGIDQLVTNKWFIFGNGHTRE